MSKLSILKNMIKFKLLKGYYITKYDSLNWIIAKDRIVPEINEKTGEKNSGAGEIKQDKLGYYPTLESAWNCAMRHQLFLAESNEEIKDIFQMLKELKVEFESELKIK
jgi:hypothetical protein